MATHFMKAIVKTRPGADDWPVGLHLEDRPIPAIDDPNSVRIKVRAAGICGTDVGIYYSKNSLRDEMVKMRTGSVVIGHEFSGQLDAAGPEARDRLARILAYQSGHDPETDDYVKGRGPSELARAADFDSFVSEHFLISAEMHITCGWCYQCRLGERHVCRNTVIRGVHQDGAFAEYVVLPSSNLVLFRKAELPVEIVAFMDALGNAVHTVQSVNLTGKSVLILGCGVQGLMATAVARLAGASKIFVTDVAQENRGLTHEKLAVNRFRLARSFGADRCFDLSLADARRDLRSHILDETGGAGVDAALEMSGSYAAYRDALDCLRMGGTFALLGLPEGTVSLNFAHDVIFRGLTIHGVIGRRVFETWETMRAMLASGLSQVFVDSGFVSHRLPLDQFETGIAEITHGNALKVILQP